MGLKDSLTKPDTKGPISWLSRMRDELPEEDYLWLKECLDNRKDFSALYLSKKLTELGYPVSPTTINNIRNGIRG